MSIDVSATLSDLVIADARRSRVLERFGLDYCCNGHVTLDAAAADAGVDLAELTGALDLPAPAEGEAVAAVPGDNAALAHDIVDTHHAYMWEEMPRLIALVDKVAGVHGERHAELAEVKEIFHATVAALEPHMTTEERQIFPAISRLEKGAGELSTGSFAEPIAQLRAEHDFVGDQFKRLRLITSGYAVPADGCNSYRMMLAGLEQMELDLHEHIHKENNILFPRVLALEESSAVTA